MTARWEDVLDTQQELWAFWQSPRGHEYARGFARSAAKDEGRPDRPPDLDRIAPIQEAILFHAEPIAIEPDMMTLIEAAQRSFQPEPLHDTDLVTEAGFIMLPRPLMAKDVWGRQVSYRAIGWMPALRTRPVPQSPALEVAADMMGWNQEEFGIWVGLYSHIDDPDDYPQEDKEGLRGMGFPDLTLSHQMCWRYGEDYTQAKSFDFAGSLAPAYHDVDWDKAIDAYVQTLRTIQSLLRLLNQHIAVRVKHRPGRATRRRAQRLDYPPKDVTIVYLRRPRAEDHPLDSAGKHVEWTHRWIVSGHWRAQPYPSLGVTRQIWIAPYTKGPEDKELRIREKRVFVFKR